VVVREFQKKCGEEVCDEEEGVYSSVLYRHGFEPDSIGDNIVPERMMRKSVERGCNVLGTEKR